VQHRTTTGSSTVAAAMEERTSSTSGAKPSVMCPSDAAELLDGFSDRLVLLDKRIHAVFGVVELFRFRQHVSRLLPRHDDDAVHIRRDDVARIHRDAGAGDRNIFAGETVVIHSSRGNCSTAENRELQLRDLRSVADTA